MDFECNFPTEPTPEWEEQRRAAQEVAQALQDAGFVYLANRSSAWLAQRVILEGFTAFGPECSGTGLGWFNPETLGMGPMIPCWFKSPHPDLTVHEIVELAQLAAMWTDGASGLDDLRAVMEACAAERRAQTVALLAKEALAGFNEKALAILKAADSLAAEGDEGGPA